MTSDDGTVAARPYGRAARRRSPPSRGGRRRGEGLGALFSLPSRRGYGRSRHDRDPRGCGAAAAGELGPGPWKESSMPPGINSSARWTPAPIYNAAGSALDPQRLSSRPDFLLSISAASPSCRPRLLHDSADTSGGVLYQIGGPQWLGSRPDVLPASRLLPPGPATCCCSKNVSHWDWRSWEAGKLACILGSSLAWSHFGIISVYRSLWRRSLF